MSQTTITPHLQPLLDALTPDWQRLADLPGDENSGTRNNQYETLVHEGLAERHVAPITIAGRPAGSLVYFRLAIPNEWDLLATTDGGEVIADLTDSELRNRAIRAWDLSNTHDLEALRAEGRRRGWATV